MNEIAEHHVVGGVLIRHRTVLLGRRSRHRRWYPGVWDLPGGHIEPGESPEAALVRELHEELGITARQVATAFELRGPGMVLHGCIVRAWEGEPVNHAPDEHDEIRFWPVEALADLDLAHPAYPEILPRLAGPGA